jgi:hypothetical protein
VSLSYFITNSVARLVLIFLFARLAKSESHYEIFIASFAKIWLLKASLAFRENVKEGFSRQPWLGDPVQIRFQFWKKFRINIRDGMDIIKTCKNYHVQVSYFSLTFKQFSDFLKVSVPSNVVFIGKL